MTSKTKGKPTGTETPKSKAAKAGSAMHQDVPTAGIRHVSRASALEDLREMLAAV